jgi:hypothetical protein
MQPLYFCTHGLRVSVSKYMEVVHIAIFADISNIENEPNLPNEDFARDNICPDY